MTETAIEQNVRAREASNTLVELGITLAKDEQLEPAAVRHMWKCVMETTAELIGEKSPPPEEHPKLDMTKARWQRPFDEAVVPDDDEPFPFGKHKDEPYGEIPDSYYKWLAKQEWIDEWGDVLNYIQANDLD